MLEANIGSQRRAHRTLQEVKAKVLWAPGSHSGIGQGEYPLLSHRFLEAALGHHLSSPLGCTIMTVSRGAPLLPRGLPGSHPGSGFPKDPEDPPGDGAPTPGRPTAARTQRSGRIGARSWGGSPHGQELSRGGGGSAHSGLTHFHRAPRGPRTSRTHRPALW